MSEKTTAERFAALRDALLSEAEAEYRLGECDVGFVAAATEAAAAAEQAIWICEQRPRTIEGMKASLEVNQAVLDAYRRRDENKP